MSFELIVIASNDLPGQYREQIIRRAASFINPAATLESLSRGAITTSIMESEPRGGGVPFFHLSDDKDTLVGLSLNSKALEFIFRSKQQKLASLGADNALIVVRIKPTADLLTIENDGVGLINAFYAEDSKLGFILSTSLHVLLALGHNPIWDRQGVIEYLACLHPLGDRTVIEGIRLLPAGALLSWGKSSKHLEVSSTPLLSPRGNNRHGSRSEEDLIAEFRQIWQSNMIRLADRTTGRLIMGLSGGLDSRSIANGLSEIGVRPLSFTYGSYTQKEVRTASRVADVLEIPHLVIPVHDSNKLAGLDRGIEMLDGAMSPVELYENWFIDELQSIGDTFVTGDSGDVFWGSDGANGLSDHLLLRQALLDRYAGNLKTLIPFLIQEWRESAMESLSASIDETCIEYAGIDRPDIATFWNLNNRQRRWGFSFVSAIRRMGLQYENPYFDAEFIKFAITLPPSRRLHGRLYLAIHREIFSKTAHIARSSGGAAPKLYRDYLYFTQVRSQRAQLLDLLRAHPRAGLHRIKEMVEIKIKGCARKTGQTAFADRIDQKHNVFLEQQWTLNNAAFRGRLFALLEDAASNAPYFIDGERLRMVSLQLKNGSMPINTLLLGRVASICLWNRIWSTTSQRSLESRPH